MKCSIITATQEQLTDDEDPKRQEKLTVIRKPIGDERVKNENQLYTKLSTPRL